MSDVLSGEGAPAVAPEAEMPSRSGPDKKAWAERVLGDILRLMELPGRLELKDAADGGISVAIFFEGEVPGVQVGRRSHLIDALQFLSNKIVNRPQTERRWISIGVGGHPEPRPPQQNRDRPVIPVAAAVPRPAREAKPLPAVRPNGAAPSAADPPPRPAVPDELALEVPEDTDVTRLGRALAEKSARLGRHYAVTPIKQEDRARMLRAGAGVAGTAVKVEGEGRNRRVVFVPDKPTPMPKKAIPDYGDEDDET